MGILYALVARVSNANGEASVTILAECKDTKNTNADVFGKKIVERIPGSNDSRFSYYARQKNCYCCGQQDCYFFHVKRTNGLAVLCMAHETDPRMIAFAFLEDIHQQFVRTYGLAAATAEAYGMHDPFSMVLSQQMKDYSNDDVKNRLRGKMSELPEIEKIDVVLGRGNHLKLFVGKNANMQGKKFHDRKEDHRQKSEAWWSNFEFWISVIAILLIVYAVLALVCHGFTLPTCRK